MGQKCPNLLLGILFWVRNQPKNPSKSNQRFGNLKSFRLKPDIYKIERRNITATNLLGFCFDQTKIEIFRKQTEYHLVTRGPKPSETPKKSKELRRSLWNLKES